MDIIFLDIEIEPINGIDTAAHLRKYNVNIPIIYITGYPDYWQKWVSVYNTIISDAGLNTSPRQFDPDSGLGNNSKKKGSWRKKK